MADKDAKTPRSTTQQVIKDAREGRLRDVPGGDQGGGWKDLTGGPHTENRYNPETGATEREIDRHAGNYQGSSTPDNLETTTPPKSRRD